MIRKLPEGNGDVFCLQCFHLFYKDKAIKSCPKCGTEYILFLADVKCSECKKLINGNIYIIHDRFSIYKRREPVCSECSAKLLYSRPVYSHLTMLDYFAGKAMQAFIENAGEVFLDREFAKKVAVASYMIAQEMLWHRNDFDLD